MMISSPESQLVCKSRASSMLVEERRQHILHLTQQRGSVRISDLSEELNISGMTIRKDLDFLESRRLVQRSHGGAMNRQSSPVTGPFMPNEPKRYFETNQKIAEAALRLIPEGGCIILGSGAIATAIAQRLRRFERLTVITNNLNVAVELASTNVEVVLIGGILRKESSSLIGPIAKDTLAEMHADVIFLDVDGFDLEVGATTPNLLESRTNRMMVEAARRCVVVCDSSRFNRRSLARVVAPTAVDQVITDRDLPQETADAIRGMEIELILV